MVILYNMPTAVKKNKDRFLLIVESPSKCAKIEDYLGVKISQSAPGRAEAGGVRTGNEGVRPGNEGVRPGNEGVRPELTGIRPCVRFGKEL